MNLKRSMVDSSEFTRMSKINLEEGKRQISLKDKIIASYEGKNLFSKRLMSM